MSRMQMNSRFRALLVPGLLITPILAAIWFLPWFITQDAPLHLYNTEIMIKSLKHDSLFQQVYVMRRAPLPYWGGYLSLMGLMSILPPRAADQVMMSITSVGFAISILWLRWRVAGREGMPVIAPFAVILSLNILWLLGLYNFLLGACFYPVTLGVWWAWRDRMGFKHALILAALLILGFFCHLVSIGLTIIALGVLAVTTPGGNWLRRLGWTASSMLPLVPLIVAYRNLMQSTAPVKPMWASLISPYYFQFWLRYLSEPDFLMLRFSRNTFPFTDAESGWFILLAPSVLLLLALLVLLVRSAFFRGDRTESIFGERRGWLILSFVILIGGFFGPDLFGEAHGGLLRERVLLFGFATLAPILKLDTRALAVKLATALLLVATAVQFGFVLDYALMSNRLAGEFMQAKESVGTGQRVEAVVIEKESRFRATPLIHLANMFGIGTGNIMWSNYAPALYYFPIGFRNESDKRFADEISSTQRYTFPEVHGDSEMKNWSSLLFGYHTYIDVLVVWDSTPELNAVHAKWFKGNPLYERGPMLVLKHR